MKEIFKNLKVGIVVGLTAFFVFTACGIIYASFNFQSLREVQPGEVLTSQEWNEVVSSMKDFSSALDGGLASPSGAVIAFYRESCPDGWSLANDLKNRVIVGAGDSYAQGATGGSATTTGTVGSTALTLAQIPSHTHTIAYATVGWTTGNLVQHYHNGTTSSSVTTGSAGSGQGHTHTFTGGSNLPPYIALIYCVKD